MKVRPKKFLGQHFLKDENIAQQVVAALGADCRNVLEIGPGTGVLSKYLLEDTGRNLIFLEIDQESIEYLHRAYPEHVSRIIEGDFLNIDFLALFPENQQIAIIGNFPYNISSQILFKTLEHHDRVHELVGMFQKEVAERITSPPGSKKYGILSVLCKAFYDMEYLFTVDETVFQPPPKVKSAVIRLKRNYTQHLECDEGLFFKVVKTAFNQRRKVLRNALKSILPNPTADLAILLSKRAERLEVEDFVRLTSAVSGGRNLL